MPTPPTYHCFRNIRPWVCVKIFSCILIIPTIISSLGVVRPNFLVHTFTHSTWPSVRLKTWVIGEGEGFFDLLGHRFLWEGPCKFTILSWSLEFSEESKYLFCPVWPLNCTRYWNFWSRYLKNVNKTLPFVVTKAIGGWLYLSRLAPSKGGGTWRPSPSLWQISPSQNLCKSKFHQRHSKPIKEGSMCISVGQKLGHTTLGVGSPALNAPWSKARLGNSPHLLSDRTLRDMSVGRTNGGRGLPSWKRMSTMSWKAWPVHPLGGPFEALLPV